MKIHQEISRCAVVYRAKFACGNKSDYFHWHKNTEFLYMRDNGFEILIDGVLYRPKKGDLIFIGEHSVHAFICKAEFMCLSLGQIAPKLLLNERVAIRPIKTHITAEEISEDPIFEKQFASLLGMMERIGNVENDKVTLFEKSIFSAFYFALMEKFPQEEQDKTLKKERQVFYQIIEYINEKFSEDINVLRLAKELYMDRGRLSHIFSKYSGMTVNEYINERRVSKANELLESGLSVTEAALESGFQSMRTFNDNYKKIMGMTPTEYLQKKDGRS